MRQQNEEMAKEIREVIIAIAKKAKTAHDHVVAMQYTQAIENAVCALSRLDTIGYYNPQTSPPNPR